MNVLLGKYHDFPATIPEIGGRTLLSQPPAAPSLTFFGFYGYFTSHLFEKDKITFVLYILNLLLNTLLTILKKLETLYGKIP